MTTPIRKKLIEVALPLEAINVASAREKSIRHGHPSTLHLWWARRPLAACRAVLFGQFVDDPSAWPDLYPTEEAQEKERERIFGLIRDLVKWESSNDETIINAARVEIARSLARGRKADGQPQALDEAVLKVAPAWDGENYRKLTRDEAGSINRYLAEVAPPVHDPFAGGGSIPLEAQRLGLRAIATDLNPVAVLINKALIEIPPRFAGQPPVNPESRRTNALKTWKGAQGLADDVRYYGKWMRDEAFKRIGHLYPQVDLPPEQGGGKATVIAWLWARTVASPNPACCGVHVPLVSDFWLSKMSGNEAWIEPIVDRTGNTWRLEVRHGKPADPKTVDAGTKTGRGSFRCVLSGDPIPSSYIQEEGRAGRMRDRLMAIIAEGTRGRIYLSRTEAQEEIARVPLPSWTPNNEFAKNSRHMTPWAYGLDTFAKLFTARQLTALVTFSNLVREARERMQDDIRAMDALVESGQSIDNSALVSFADGLSVFLALVVSSLSDRLSTICTWDAGGRTWGTKTRSTFSRPALSMSWDFTEVNCFSTQSGSWQNSLEYATKAIECFGLVPSIVAGTCSQADATSCDFHVRPVISTDPPYYDNVPYADISDYFYVWLRQSLSLVIPEIFTTMLVPKTTELVAEPFRHGGKVSAGEFFFRGMSLAISNMASFADAAIPTTIYYAFKQAETGEKGTTSTGWETFLKAVIDSGFAVVGTWPMRTELGNRMRSMGSNALASSIVLVCRKRSDEAPATDRAAFRRLLRQELPGALRYLQKGNIAPVDVAQASIGPGMAIFSRHARVLEADGSSMSVRTALQLINQALDEYLTEQEGELDADTRFAVTWFETRQFDAGAFGEAETLAKARNVSVAGVVEAGVLHSVAGKVRLLRREELPDDWDPATDNRLTIWEATQHLIKRIEAKGEEAGADLLARLGANAAPARDLAYRLYATCERKGWAEEARAYNGLVVAWPELEKLAARVPSRGPKQESLL